jgi:hypothetical protein
MLYVCGLFLVEDDVPFLCEHDSPMKLLIIFQRLSDRLFNYITVCRVLEYVKLVPFKISHLANAERTRKLGLALRRDVESMPQKEESSRSDEIVGVATSASVLATALPRF